MGSRIIQLKTRQGTESKDSETISSKWSVRPKKYIQTHQFLNGHARELVDQSGTIAAPMISGDYFLCLL